LARAFVLDLENEDGIVDWNGKTGKKKRRGEI